MSRAGWAIVVVALSLGGGGSAVGAEEVYRVDVLPDDLDKIPCSAWKRNADGTWTQTARIIVGGQDISGGSFLNNRETLMLEGRCRTPD